MLTPWKESYDQPRQHIKRQRHYFANKDPSSQSYGFSSGHVWMWELGYKESWALKNCCFWTVVLEKTLESPLHCKEIQWVPPKGDQSWVFIGRTDAEAETPVLWPPDAESWLIWKDPDAGRGWGQEEKGTTEHGMVEWYHWLDGHECGWTPGVGDGQGGLACCSSWGRRVRHDWATELNWSHKNPVIILRWSFMSTWINTCQTDFNSQFWDMEVLVSMDEICMPLKNSNVNSFYLIDFFWSERIAKTGLKVCMKTLKSKDYCWYKIMLREKAFIVRPWNCFHSHGTTPAVFKTQQMISRRKVGWNNSIFVISNW